MEKLILQEKDYDMQMRQKVEPYLLERKSVFRLEREPGRELYYERYLADDAAGIVVISHGFTETAEKYEEIIYYFLKKQYHVYMPEHCGHGRSYRLVEDLSLVHTDSYLRYVKDVLAVAEIAEKEQPDLPRFLYGHSMGGGIAAAVLAERPGFFQRAVLSSPMIRPLTGGIPWPIAKMIVSVLCLLGKQETYVPGQHAFDDGETFETSAATCRERFDFYQEKRRREPLYQMSGASCGWLREAGKLNAYLQREGWKKIATPLLIFQAQEDGFVCAKEQVRFAGKIKKAGNTTAKMLYMPGSKHEIFNSPRNVLCRYWKAVFSFFSQG